MCILTKLSQECKNENTIYMDQLKRLTLCFSSIEDSEIRESIIYFF